MAVTQSASKPVEFPHGKLLLQLARDSIAHGLKTGTAIAVDPGNYPQDLREPRAVFVTLDKGGELRGCIGTLEARQALVKEVADSAFAAAFRDTRFPPLGADELDALHIHISVLTPQQQLDVRSEQELLDLLLPGVDGLTLEEGYFRSTFLPDVWEKLPDKREFLQHLKLKAGLPADYWSDSIKVFRYRTVGVEE